MGVSLMSAGVTASAEAGTTIAAAVWPDTNQKVFLQYNSDYFTCDDSTSRKLTFKKPAVVTVYAWAHSGYSNMPIFLYLDGKEYVASNGPQDSRIVCKTFEATAGMQWSMKTTNYYQECGFIVRLESE